MQSIEFTDETRALYQVLNKPMRQFGAEETIQASFEEQVKRTPTGIAVVCGEDQISYADLNARANSLAKVLVAHGVEQGSMVAFYCDRSVQLVEIILAILKCGAAYVPFDPQWPEERIAYLLDTVESRVLVCDLQGSAPSWSTGRSVVTPCSEYWEPGCENPKRSGQVDDTAYVNFTSGSTGQPKGVDVAHRGVLRLVQHVTYTNLNAKTRTLHLAPIAFDAATFEIWGPLLNGGTCVIYAKPDVQLSDLKASIKRGSVNTLFLTTALFNAFMEIDASGLSDLEHILTGGEAHSIKHINHALEVFGPGRVSSVYGPTECTTFSTYYPIVRAAEVEQPLPIGKPIQDTNIYVLDGYRACGIGETGTVYVAGPGLANGYVKNPDETSRRFVDLLVEGEVRRLYDTGDNGFLNDDLDIVFIGRADDQVKINGYRVELGEIATQLNTLDDVQQSFVTTRRSSSGESSLLAFVLVSDESVTPRSLQTLLEANLPRYMLPKIVVRTTPFPLTSTNKINKAALLSSIEDGTHPLRQSASKVQEALNDRGVDVKVRELPASTRTAKDAAKTLGCTVSQIVKSIVFKTIKSDAPILVLASGSNRIDTAIVAEIVGQAVEQASPKYVKKTTGFAIGGVPPIGHKTSPRVIVDQDLLKLKRVWAAAGTPNAVFSLDLPITDVLEDCTVAEIKERADA